MKFRAVARPWGWGSVVLSLLVSIQSSAQATAVISIDCPGLIDEQRHSLEARALAELAGARTNVLELQVQCVVPVIVVDLTIAGQPSRSHSATLSEDRSLWVDTILTLIHRSVLTRAQSRDLRDAGSVPALADTSDRQSSTPPPKPTEPARQMPPPIRPYGAAVAVGACSEFWLSPGNVLLGPCLALGLIHRSSLRIAAIGSGEWSLASPSNFVAQQWQAGIAAKWGRSPWMGIGSQIARLELTPNAGLSPKSRVIYRPSASLRAGLATPLQKNQLLVGLGVGAHLFYYDVRVDDRTAFRLPAFVLNLGAEYEIGL